MPVRHVLLLALLFSGIIAKGQKVRRQTFSIAFSNNNTAYPFGKFAGLAVGPYHPGLEAGYSIDWIRGRKHDWFQNFRAGYMFHRFVQHGIPIYTQGGYRYKFNSHIHAYTTLGAGYFHSIPATAVFKLDDNGEYKKAKGIGRPQLMLCFEMGLGYTINPLVQNAISVFINYQQRIQTPFVRSYVPMLPYNILQIGISRTITQGSTKAVKQ